MKRKSIRKSNKSTVNNRITGSSERFRKQSAGSGTKKRSLQCLTKSSVIYKKGLFNPPEAQHTNHMSIEEMPRPDSYLVKRDRTSICPSIKDDIEGFQRVHQHHHQQQDASRFGSLQHDDDLVVTSSEPNRYQCSTSMGANVNENSCDSDSKAALCDLVDDLVRSKFLSDFDCALDQSASSLQTLQRTDDKSVIDNCTRLRRIDLPTKTERLKCRECGIICETYNELKAHLIKHEPHDVMPASAPGKKAGYLCKLCNKTFSAGYDIKKHIRVHSREQPFSCDLCGERFSQWGNLRLHWQRHLSIKPYQCPFCQKAYIAPSKLEVHIRGHTNDRPFNCEVCVARFKSNDDLRKHMMIHTNYRPFFCWICKKGFMQPSKLRTHMHEKHDIPVSVIKTDVTEDGIEYKIKINCRQSADTPNMTDNHF